MSNIMLPPQPQGEVAEPVRCKLRPVVVTVVGACHVTDTEADKVSRWCHGWHGRRAGGAYGVYITRPDGSEIEAGYGSWIVEDGHGSYVVHTAEQFEALYTVEAGD